MDEQNKTKIVCTSYDQCQKQFDDVHTSLKALENKIDTKFDNFSEQLMKSNEELVKAVCSSTTTVKTGKYSMFSAILGGGVVATIVTFILKILGIG